MVRVGSFRSRRLDWIVYSVCVRIERAFLNLWPVLRHMGIELDKIGGNLLRGSIALVLWILAGSIIQLLVTPFLPHNWTVFVGVGLGFVVAFGGFSYWYYRQQPAEG